MMLSFPFTGNMERENMYRVSMGRASGMLTLLQFLTAVRLPDFLASFMNGKMNGKLLILMMLLLQFIVSLIFVTIFSMIISPLFTRRMAIVVREDDELFTEKKNKF